MPSRGNPGNGPAKGNGNGNPKSEPFNSETGRAARARRGQKEVKKSGFLAAKMRAYREQQERDNPGFKPRERPLNSREFSELAKDAAPECLTILLDIASSPNELALARVRAAEIIIERGHGKAPLTINHERKMEDLTDAELAAELERITREHGLVITADPGSYRDIGGAEEAGKPQIVLEVVRDSAEADGLVSTKPPRPTD